MAKQKVVPVKRGGKASPRKSAAQGSWIVTTSGNRAIADIAKDLKAAGVAVEQTLHQIGVLTVKADKEAIGKARAVRGVSDVSPDHPVNIGPPNSRDTW
jgi:hypothetical protein